MIVNESFNVQQLKELLFEVKTKVYNSQIERATNKDGIKETRYKKGPLEYLDLVYGNQKSFLGLEISKFNEVPKWAMNYYGMKVSDIVDTEEMWQFMFEALGHIEMERPYVGPSYFKKGKYEYIETSQGDINKIAGEIKVLYEDNPVFLGSYHGCLL
ncbi:MAG: DUF5680 domain-containing protein [Candidatus Aenigmarchaeota archaeon]|nr:DUF5680 domain-containing protein [Candidatus Aenigmarchaeota archaeon]